MTSTAPTLQDDNSSTKVMISKMTATGRVQVSEGVELFYELYGNDSAPHKLLCVVGWGSNHKVWENQIKYFAGLEEYQMCVFDNRGSGLSSYPPGPYTMEMFAKDTVALADHLSWSQFHLIGNSMGGMIAQRIAVIAPHRIVSLSLLVTRIVGGWWESMPTWTGLYNLVRQVVNKHVWADEEADMHAWMDTIFSNTWLSSKASCGRSNRDNLFERLVERKKTVPPQTAEGRLAQLHAINGHLLTTSEIKSLASAPFPILILSGDNDLLIPHKHSIHMKSVLPKAELFIIQGAGHGILEENPSVVNEKIKVFTSSTPSN